MHKELEVGDYLLVISALQKDDPADAENVIGFNARVIVTRLDRTPIHGAVLTEDSGEMSGGHGPFATVGDAIAHGEAWGRHFVARVLGGAV
ncbi:hypothetical protein SAMN05446927_7964 [Caballeronia arationis]|jgi:hypothetical protein|uniref:Uncharacterized protein n=1 Tax=Caballeronia arationis TaxID=1777142 RepID=A0A7Z7IEQ6_9BURK|nr:hypothetical protein [Caballeronia arationis]SOE89368.1 hypothetical protein SAMN05446927_7964 [Caballeronia arationis]